MNISFITIYTDQMAASVEFYTKVMDFKVQRQFKPRPGMQITFLEDSKGSVLEFISDENVPKYEGRGISIGFNVEDIEATLKHLKSHHVEIVYGPVTMGNVVKLLHAKDLNGVELGFVQNP